MWTGGGSGLLVRWAGFHTTTSPLMAGEPKVGPSGLFPPRVSCDVPLNSIAAAAVERHTILVHGDAVSLPPLLSGRREAGRARLSCASPWFRAEPQMSRRRP